MSPESKSKAGIHTDTQTGTRVIPASTRPDGTTRKEIRVRPGYKPPEDVEVYKNRAAESWKTRGSGGVPGAASAASDDNDNDGGAANNKNAKRREARRRAKEKDKDKDKDKDKARDNENEVGEKNEAAKPIPTTTRADLLSTLSAPEQADLSALVAAPPSSSLSSPAVPPSAEAEAEKQARKLQKKLRQARELRDKKESGESLLPEQVEKVIRISELIRQLDGLGFDAEGVRKTGGK